MQTWAHLSRDDIISGHFGCLLDPRNMQLGLMLSLLSNLEMTAPSEKSLQNLGGKGSLDKDLSDDFSPSLRCKESTHSFEKLLAQLRYILQLHSPRRKICGWNRPQRQQTIPDTTE